MLSSFGGLEMNIARRVRTLRLKGIRVARFAELYSDITLGQKLRIDVHMESMQRRRSACCDGWSGRSVAVHFADEMRNGTLEGLQVPLYFVR